ncbi:sodium/myo-inositol cotransporter [Trachemys scripta elegans]|uniref:sodium/myo-inositol cotransporter n=1 Tax=Trachemys scripta elegans TaxID=31138 RepID=UPI0015573495|nr:sodium/myo-inositol cotransporter [Trachemys scripta elegans]XP_034608174.1 sodium/myo-inositol cotransporter [Trachemys scripta elegans]XP_034608186.1 sodium/myo-inositol cotransporter [Trachemys scripta elegans]XP_034608195.1 sodium/myo-inositol cotransporter [Trachemys scripta elegans]XP_034608206.1 sodium/myo-inositol cotransporter [Trachemys scripta elegans]XP_034608217.1 sodium/myo-inositol cotransporter [Trachemys scripta elegans]
MRASLETADIAIVTLYFVLVLCIGFFAMWKYNRSTVSGYFLAGRSMTWVAIGASLFVSNIGSEHFIGLAGSGAASGFAVGAWEFNALMLLQLLGWVFIPVYIRSGVYTMPEYLSKRFGGHRIQIYFAALSLILYIFTKLSVDLYSGALFIQESLGWNLYLSVILLIGMTALLTVTGGLVAVIYTDTLQALLMIIGALTLMIISMMEVGGFEEVKRRYMLATPNITSILLTYNLSNTNSCHVHPKPDALKMLREPTDEDVPWPGFLFGQTPASVWYWCADQVIVQRVLAAKNIAHAKGSTLMAGFLKLLPMFIIVIPGMISRILFADEIACINPEHCMQVCGSRAGCSNIAYPRLVMKLVPVGLRGLMMAVMIAALMSDLDSIFNSASTIFTLDVYKLIRKSAPSRELMIVGRVFVAFMVIISIAWVPIIVEMQGGQMYLYIQEVADYLTPPVAALFLLGIFWKRCNEQGAFYGGMVGFVLGSTRLILAFIYRAPECNQPDTRPGFIKNIHYMYIATALFWITGIVTITVSLFTPPPTKEQIRTTTFWSLKIRPVKENASKGDPYKVQEKTILKCNENANHILPNGKSEENIKNIKPEDINLLVTCREDSNPVISVSHSEVETPVDCYSNGQVALMGEKKREEETDNRDKHWKFIDWFCGFRSRNMNERAIQDTEEETLCLQMLEETPKVKLLLNIGLFCVCSLGIFMFVYFSL